jgi:hypothetical protein
MMSAADKDELVRGLAQWKFGYSVPETRVWCQHLEAALAYIAELEQAVVALSLRCESMEKAAPEGKVT